MSAALKKNCARLVAAGVIAAGESARGMARKVSVISTLGSIGLDRTPLLPASPSATIHSMSRLIAAGAVVCACLWLPATAGATTVRLLTHDQLITHADRVIVGRVESRESFWRGTRIFTRQRVAVEQTWLGEARQTLEVLTLGGVVGEIGQQVAGAARLRLGERVVLYLAEGPGGDHWIVGMWQGAFEITAAVPAAPQGVIRSQTAPSVGATPQMPQTLDALEGEVRRGH